MPAVDALSLRHAPDGSRAALRVLQGLNEEQCQAVVATEGACLVVAGAGSGKTKVLTHRIAHLVHDHEVHPGQILAITFTNKAAREMAERLHALVGPPARGMWVSTFHSACARILRRHGARLGYRSTLSIYDDADAERLLTQVLRELRLDPKRTAPRALRNAISRAKDELITPDDYRARASTGFEHTVSDVYRLYQHQLVQASAVDFDDLIVGAVRLLRDDEEVRAEYHNRLRYVLVDEFQDTNLAQYELVKLLAAREGNLTVVGDADQSIYGFRGASSRNILEFESDHPHATAVVLEQNYRSTQTILSAANAVIDHNLRRKPKRLWTDQGDGHPIVRADVATEHDEAAWILAEIERLHEAGVSYKDIVVFYRTNAQSRVLEEVFVRGALPHRVLGGPRFYDRKEVKDLLAYLRVILNPHDVVSLRRIVNVPKRGIGETSERALQRFADEAGIPLSEALVRAEEVEGLGRRPALAAADLGAVLARLRSAVENAERPSEVVRQTWAESGLLADLERDRSIEAMGRVENLRELASVAADYEAREQEPTLEGFLESVSLVSEADQADGEAELVTLMTLHTAKGLEFPVVFIAGMEENVFPHLRSVADPDQLEEERRLVYVGITRARERLYLSCASCRSLFGSTTYNMPSRFLAEIPADLLMQAATPAPPAWKPAPGWGDASPPFGAGRGPRAASSGRALPVGGVATGAGGPATHSGPALKSGPKSGEGEALDLGLQVGDEVEHATYGGGRIIGLTGEGERMVAEVVFRSGGAKRLLLRYAPLQRA